MELVEPSVRLMYFDEGSKSERRLQELDEVEEVRNQVRLGHELWSLKGGLGEPSRKRSPLAISKQAT